MIRKTIYLLLIICSFQQAYPFNVRVHLFNQFNLKTVALSPVEGKYQFQTETGFTYRVKKNHIIYITSVGDSLSIWDAESHLGIFKQVSFQGSGKQNIFKIESAYPALPQRLYEDDIFITSHHNILDVENHVQEENYLSGVIEAEAGPNAELEFYKTQAIISRTYLYAKIAKEGADRYFIGDDVNYQVFKGMCRKNPNIRLAVSHTAKLVIVDTSEKLITATFHANSGGQTANSEDVWLAPTSYLKAKPDPFSLNQTSAHWQDSVLIDDWINYLKKNGINLNTEKAIQDNLSFDQQQRGKYYVYQNDSIPLRKIRSDFKFRSTWFSFHTRENYIFFYGKGYGHGVGLSQDGAMQMAREQYSFNDIIHYYYQNVKVIPYNLLPQQ